MSVRGKDKEVRLMNNYLVLLSSYAIEVHYLYHTPCKKHAWVLKSWVLRSSRSCSSHFLTAAINHVNVYTVQTHFSYLNNLQKHTFCLYCLLECSWIQSRWSVCQQVTCWLFLEHYYIVLCRQIMMTHNIDCRKSVFRRS